MKRKVKTTVEKKPNKNQQEETNKQRRKHQTWKRQQFKYGEQKSQTAKSDRTLDLRKGCEEICFKEGSTNEEREGATKIEQKRHNENVISKGVDEGKQTETWNLERDNRRKRRDNK